MSFFYLCFTFFLWVHFSFTFNPEGWIPELIVQPKTNLLFTIGHPFIWHWDCHPLLLAILLFCELCTTKTFILVNYYVLYKLDKDNVYQQWQQFPKYSQILPVTNGKCHENEVSMKSLTGLWTPVLRLWICIFTILDFWSRKWPFSDEWIVNW